MNSKELFTERLTKGNRTYFFDIKEAENRELYLKITESKKSDNGFERFSVMVFEEDLIEFEKTFQKCLLKYNELKELKKKEEEKKAYSVEKIREEHKNAYLPWTEKEDEKLELLFCEGVSIHILSQVFERQEGAIQSRIKKLELKEKYS